MALYFTAPLAFVPMPSAAVGWTARRVLAERHVSRVYLIRTYNGAEGGSTQMSSQPMLAARSHMDRPD